MNKEIKQVWIEALKSKKYPEYIAGTIETAGALHCGDAYCIYGVLCELHREKFGGEWSTNAFNKHLVYLNETGFPPDQVLQWLEIKVNKPTMAHFTAAGEDKNRAYELANPKGSDLALLVEWMSLGNRKSFTEMADIIEGKEIKCDSLSEVPSVLIPSLGKDSLQNQDPLQPADSNLPQVNIPTALPLEAKDIEPLDHSQKD